MEGLTRRCFCEALVALPGLLLGWGKKPDPKVTPRLVDVWPSYSWKAEYAKTYAIRSSDVHKFDMEALPLPIIHEGFDNHIRRLEEQVITNDECLWAEVDDLEKSLWTRCITQVVKEGDFIEVMYRDFVPGTFRTPQVPLRNRYRMAVKRLPWRESRIGGRMNFWFMQSYESPADEERVRRQLHENINWWWDITLPVSCR